MLHRPDTASNTDRSYSWSALGGVLVTGVNAGGPPVMIWGWVGISCVSLCVAYSMAEMCSEYPVAGGESASFLLMKHAMNNKLTEEHLRSILMGVYSFAEEHSETVLIPYWMVHDHRYVMRET